ncbi:MAG: hypothetical protein GXO82_04915 [Chlorobi bacterium]|nr:hypothetical protein [Chlorobiota bacterium]
MINELPSVFREIIRDHDDLRSAFAALVATGMKAGEQGPEAAPETAVSLGKRLHEIDGLVGRHVRKEEEGVFPVLRAVLSAGDEPGNTIFEVLEAEHVHLEKALATLTGMCASIGSGTTPSPERLDLMVTKLRIVQAEFLAHFMKEEKGIYSRAAEVLTEDGFAKIERALASL